MKLFKSLLVAPATLGLLAPLSATANEVTINDFNPAEEIAVTNSRVDGLEARMNEFEAGGFSETTTASFSLDTVIGAVDGAANSSAEALGIDYQMNIGLSTSFTGEDSLDVTIDIGGADGTSNLTSAGSIMGFQATNNRLEVDGITYTFPLAGATVVVGDTTDISSTFTGACVYSAFTDYLSNCGTDNSVGVGGKGVTASVGYAFDSGFSIAGGVSSPEKAIMTTESDDMYGIEVAYTADTYGLSLAYTSKDGGTDFDTTYWGVNAFYIPDADALPSISVGFETEELVGYYQGYFVGLTWDEVGPGSLSLGASTNRNFLASESDLMTYEASYSYPINDGMTITPGVYIKETAAGTDDDTGYLVKTSFSF